MADLDYAALQLNPDYTETEYQTQVVQQFSTTNIGGDVTIITTINGGGGGQATGPAITLGSNWSGVNFVATAGQVNIEITSAANARTALGAAASGINGDITRFTGLTGNTGFNAWTGTPNQASHPTYSGTASVGYVQAELQGVMDSLQQVTGFIMALVTALLAGGVIET